MVNFGFYVDLLIESAIIVTIAGILGESFSFIVRRVAKRAGARPSTLRSVRDVIRIVWVSLAAFGVASASTYLSEFSILTASGIAGLIVSLALQTTLANMIAGFLLLRDGAVRLDDVIEYSGVKGRVIRVALRNTWILTDQGKVAVIGNSALQGGPTINHTASERFAREYNT